MKFKKTFVALALSSLVLGGCFLDDDNTPLSAGDVFVLTSNGQLATFNRSEPSVVRTSVQISGVMNGDTLLGMDFRPRDGQLYAIARTTPGNGGRLYTINTTTGVATAGAVLIPAATPTANGPFTTLDATATSFSVDFNPAADALRVISDGGQNLRLFVANATGRTAGETFLDGTTNTSSPSADLSGAAYTNSFDGTTTTRLLNIDTAGDNLTFQNPPNDGTQVVAAPLGVNASGTAGFDIDPRNNVGYALLNVGSSVGFYRIAIPDSTASLTPTPTTPAATFVGNVNVQGVVGIALAPTAAPQAIALDGNTAGTQRLLKFGIRNPNAATATAITGLPSGERLLSIDFRPSNSTVYGLSSAGKIFTVDPDTGAATLAVTLNIATNIVNGLAETPPKRYQIDFNPQADALRIVSSLGSGTQGQNNRILGARLTAGVMNAGVTATDDQLLTAGFNIASIAYTNSFASPAPTITQLFNADSDNNRLAQQGNPLVDPAVSPNTGALTSVGDFRTSVVTDATTTPPTGTFDLTTFNAYGGFDISGGDNGMTLMANRIGNSGAFSLFTLGRAAITAGNPTSANGVSIAAVGTSSGNAEIATSTDIRALTIKF